MKLLPLEWAGTRLWSGTSVLGIRTCGWINKACFFLQKSRSSTEVLNSNKQIHECFKFSTFQNLTQINNLTYFRLQSVTAHCLTQGELTTNMMNWFPCYCIAHHPQYEGGVMCSQIAGCKSNFSLIFSREIISAIPLIVYLKISINFLYRSFSYVNSVGIYRNDCSVLKST
jgi:hypothetical protein